MNQYAATPAPAMKEDTKTASLREKISAADRINGDERTVLGAVLTMVSFIAFAVYVVGRIISFLTTPPPQLNSILWTSMAGVIAAGPMFPIELNCTSPSGCSFRVHYSGSSVRSQTCVQARHGLVDDCLTAGYGASVEVDLCYSDLPLDGLYAFHRGDNTSAPAFGVSVPGVMESPSGPMPFATPVYGRTQLHLVRTENRTYAKGAEGAVRMEWFPTLLSATVEPDASVPTCAGNAIRQAEVTLLSLGASWTKIEVASRFGEAFAIYGECGGALGLLLETASLALFLSACVTRGTSKSVRLAKTGSQRFRRPEAHAAVQSSATDISNTFDGRGQV